MSPKELSPFTISSTNLAAEAVRANCSSADSVRRSSDPSVSCSSLVAAAASARQSNEDPDLLIVAIIFSVVGFARDNGGIAKTAGGVEESERGFDETSTSGNSFGAAEGAGKDIAGEASLFIHLILLAKIPFGWYVDGGRNQGGVGGLSRSISSWAFPAVTLLIFMEVLAGTPTMTPAAMIEATPGDFTRFVWATRLKNLLSSSPNSILIC